MRNIRTAQFAKIIPIRGSEEFEENIIDIRDIRMIPKSYITQERMISQVTYARFSLK